jgi:hypothetical protein
MTEEQADRMIKLLAEINDRLETMAHVLDEMTSAIGFRADNSPIFAINVVERKP